VADGLRISLHAGQTAVSHIVGRDPQVLDESGVSKAAIESLAESTSDAVVAPLFWLLLLGLPGIVLYKAINTADSMVGHKSERYLQFGWASARLDDVANWIPARLTALLIAGTCLLVPRTDAEAAWSTALRDAGRHSSPNSGWPEAAFAGALHIALGGQRSYEGEVHDLPTFGSGQTNLTSVDVLRALSLYWAALNVLLVVALVLSLILWRIA
jgi:adenosylcobinamide-phosphate synthase